jgi:hypothetical protein
MRWRSWRPLANFRRIRALAGGDLRRSKKAVRIRTRIFAVRGHSVTLRRGEPEPAGHFATGEVFGPVLGARAAVPHLTRVTLAPMHQRSCALHRGRSPTRPAPKEIPA